jgi:hypothetical protein
MAGIGYLGALVLAVVFVWAAAAKLARPDQTVAGLAALKVPKPAVMAWAVPAVELVTAALLAAVPRVGGLIALALLAVFSLVIARAVMGGVTAGCSCFGAVSNRPVSAHDLGRNAILAALALAAGATPEPSAPPIWGVAVVLAAAVLWVTAFRRRTDGPAR